MTQLQLTDVEHTLLHRYGPLLPSNAGGMADELRDHILESVQRVRVSGGSHHPRTAELLALVKTYLEDGWVPLRPKPLGFDELPHDGVVRQWGY